MEIIYKKDDDIKVKLHMMLDGHVVKPLSVPFEVRLWTNSTSTAIIAGWDGRSFFGGCSVISDYVQIVSDANPKWWEGVIHGEAVLHYPDSEMPDRSFDKVIEIVFDTYDTGEITAHVDHVVYGLSAYDLDVKRGYVGTIDQWMDSLHGKDGKGATIISKEFDAEGNTVIEWSDGNVTIVHKGEKGNDGYTPVKGVDYFDGKDGENGKDGRDGGVIFPRFSIDEAEDGRKHLYCIVPQDGQIDAHVEKIDGVNHLILEI